MTPRRLTHEHADRRMYARTAAATREHEYDVAVRTSSARGSGPSTAHRPLDGPGHTLRGIGSQRCGSRLRRVGPARPGQPGAHHANHEPTSFGTGPPGKDSILTEGTEWSRPDSPARTTGLDGALRLARTAPPMERNAGHCNIAAWPRRYFNLGRSELSNPRLNRSAC